MASQGVARPVISQRHSGGRLALQQAPVDVAPAFAGTTVHRGLIFPNSHARSFKPSLRANGSRECAPDDRLREAIQLWHRKLESWIASSQVLLAMTTRCESAISRPDMPEVCWKFPCPPIRGRRECRAPDAPDSRVCNECSRAHTR
jgi:hypothetical protein